MWGGLSNSLSSTSPTQDQRTDLKIDRKSLKIRFTQVSVLAETPHIINVPYSLCQLNAIFYLRQDFFTDGLDFHMLICTIHNEILYKKYYLNW